MTTLPDIDTALFLAVQHLPHPAVAVFLAAFLSGIGAAGIIWFFIGLILYVREEKKDHRFFLPIAFSGLTSWTLVEAFLKTVIARPRPYESLHTMLYTTPLSDASFPSGHATIAWAMATVLAAYEPGMRWWFYTLAAAISMSRIYLGVHYPSDVLAGALLGWGIGYVTRVFFPAVRRKKTGAQRQRTGTRR